MKFFILALIGLTPFLSLSAEFNPEGTWQGVMIRAGQKMNQGTLFYAEFSSVVDRYFSGQTREEMYDSPYFSVKKIDGGYEDGRVTFSQVVETESKKTSQIKWCKMAADLTYDEKTGYLKGTYVSTDCRRVMGEIILFRADFKLSTEEEIDVSHIWFDQFIKDYNDGLSAPEIRKIERDNFVFEPIFFDYDEFVIRPEHYKFLDGMIKVVKGHSDLRVKVIGHTDSDGSTEYNDTLSMNRARAITDYFVKRGLSADRLVIDFKGERLPADTNNTPEGKQRNRRVDFEFI